MSVVNEFIAFGQPAIAYATAIGALSLIGADITANRVVSKANNNLATSLPDPEISQSMKRVIQKSERKKSRAFWAGLALLGSLGLNFADPYIQHSKSAQGTEIVIADGLSSANTSTIQRIDNEVTASLKFAVNSKTPTAFILGGKIVGQVNSGTKTKSNFDNIKLNFQSYFNNGNQNASSVINQDITLAKAQDINNQQNVIILGNNLSSSDSSLASLTKNDYIVSINQPSSSQNNTTNISQINNSEAVIYRSIANFASQPLGKPISENVGYFKFTAILSG